jgi:hypothetical protein
MLLTQFPLADPVVLRRYTGADGAIYARYVSALPDGPLAAADAYML